MSGLYLSWSTNSFEPMLAASEATIFETKPEVSGIMIVSAMSTAVAIALAMLARIASVSAT
jgi:hypothetical protein